jgi:nitroreductase
MKMEFNQVIESRRSIRKFKESSIPDKVLDKLYGALNLAPSANNNQPYRFIFVKDAEIRKQIVTIACHQPSLLDAPLIVVACCDQGKGFDVAIAVDHLILAATDEGLGTCWIGWIEREEIKKILGIPDNIEVHVIIPIGFANESPEARPRKPLSNLIMFDKYQP